MNPEFPLPANILIFLGVLVLVSLIFLVIGVLHYCFWRQPPPPEDPPAFDMNMDYGGWYEVSPQSCQLFTYMVLQWNITLPPPDTYCKGEDGLYSAGAATSSGEQEVRDSNSLYEGGPVIIMPMA